MNNKHIKIMRGRQIKQWYPLLSAIILALLLGSIFMFDLLKIELELPAFILFKEFDKYQHLNEEADLPFSSLLVSKCSFNKMDFIDELFWKIGKPTYNCSKLVPFGDNNNVSKFDANIGSGKPEVAHYGRKWVCMDEESAIDPNNCHVYSFGINNEWSFDDAFAKYGCKVYSFDPTMTMKNHQRSPNVTFYNIGVSNVTAQLKIGNKSCKVARLQEIRRMLRHKTTKIDYLKLDIDPYEPYVLEDLWTNSPEILTDYVAQIGLIIHFGKNKMYKKYWRLAEQLECLGFELTSNDDMHQKKAPWPDIVNLAFYNKRLLFYGN